MTPTGIAGENSPLWLSTGLVTLGLMGWLAAGVAAPTEPGETRGVRKAAPALAAVVSEPEPQPQPIAKLDTPTPPKPVPEPCAPVVELQFASGSSDVADATALETILAAAERFSDRKIVVEGYASATGSPHRNLELSHRRAGRAKAKLVAAGIANKRVRVQAFGEYRPNLAGDADQDRRVLIRLEGLPSCPTPQGDE
ncbi:MAG: OmpA family protein [Nannocystales bacterium]